MRIVILPSDDTGCGSYRMIWPAAVVSKLRPDWSVEIYRPGDIDFVFSVETGELVQIKNLPDPEGIDLLILQRPGLAGMLKILAWCQKHGIATSIDNDDALWCIDRANNAWAAWNKGGDRLAHWKWIDEMTTRADHCTVTTPALARRYGKHGRVSVIPNRVPVLALQAPRIRDQFDPLPSFGWAGVTATHPGDLKVVGDSVRRVLEEIDCRARVVADAKGAARDWGVDESQVESIPPQKVGHPYYSSLSSFDVMLVPLRESPFNQAKSSLKALEAMSQGTAVIATPTQANRELTKDLPILLARTPAEWYSHLHRLMTDPAEAVERGLSGRQAVIDKGWTLEGGAQNWIDAWERAVTRRRAITDRGAA